MLEAQRDGPAVSTADVVRLGVALTLCALVLMSVRFARYDWTGIPLEFLPASTTVEVDDGCVEDIGTWVTSGGRELSPVSMDDEQYLAMVEEYRGVAASDAQVECLYRPYTGRYAQPWLAHLLPFDEAVSLSLVNVALMVVAIWAMLFALATQKVSRRSFVVIGVLFALGWNTLMFGSTTLTDPGVLAVVSIGWLLVVRRQWMWCLVFTLVALPVRETSLVLLPVLLVGFWRDRIRRDLPHSVPVMAVATVVVALGAVLAMAFWGHLGPQAAATFSTQVNVDVLVSNIMSPSIVTILVGAGPLYIPALARWSHEVRAHGLVDATLRPASTGLACTAVLMLWVLLSADFSSRFTWVGFPFAAALAAEWIDAGGMNRLLGRIAPERLLGTGGRGSSVVGPASRS